MIPPAILVLALLAAGYATLIFLIKRAQFRRWIRVPGKVIGLVPRKKEELPTAAPRVVFHTTEGQKVEFTSNVATHPAPKIGAGVEVIYNPSNPCEARIGSFGFKHAGEAVMFCMGLAVVIVYLCQRWAGSPR